jgi:hypothetical protein
MKILKIIAGLVIGAIAGAWAAMWLFCLPAFLAPLNRANYIAYGMGSVPYVFVGAAVGLVIAGWWMARQV